MLAILYNKQLCCLSQDQNVIRNPSAKFGSETEVSGEPMATKSWKRKHWLTCEAELLRFAARNEVDPLRYLKWHCSASLPQAELLHFATLNGIASLRYQKRSWSSSLPEVELVRFATRSGVNLCFSANPSDCRVIRSVILVRIEKLNCSASDS